MKRSALIGECVSVFQWMLEAQNQRIDELVERIKQQQDKLDKQNIRLRTLQSQVSKRPQTLTPINNADLNHITDLFLL